MKDLCNRYEKANMLKNFYDETLNAIATIDEIRFIREIIQLRYELLLRERI